MRTWLLLSVSCLTATLAAAETNSPSISITQDGTLAIQGSAEVPRYAQGGNWTEMSGKSSARYATRHFLFMVPNGPPAMELYVTSNLANEPPDGGFEIGLVSGFLFFDEAVVGSARVKRCRVELSKGEKKIWLYAYVFVRQPSLTFLTLRPQADARASIEDYLRGARLK